MSSVWARILFAALCFVAAPAYAQSNWPSRQVEIVVPFPAGGSYDAIARPLADFLSKKFNQNFIVVNKAGAVGMIGAQYVVSAKPDGYTLLLNGSGPGLNNMLTQKSIAYNPIKDLTPIIVMCEFPMIIAAHKDFPPKDLKEFVAYAKANPGKVGYATSGFGAQGHLMAALFILKTGIELNMVPFQGSGPASVALVGGHVPVTFDSLSAYVPHIQSGAVKAYAVTSAQRASNLPDIPTVREAGFPEAEASGWQGLSGPAGMPAGLVNQINAAAREFLASPEGKQMAATTGMNLKGNTPQEMAAFLENELKKWGPPVKAGNIVQ